MKTLPGHPRRQMVRAEGTVLAGEERYWEAYELVVEGHPFAEYQCTDVPLAGRDLPTNSQ